MSTFATVLAEYQRRSGRSQRMVALKADLDPGRYSRLLHGEREPTSREQVVALATALGLNPMETDRLVAAAGYLPPSLERVGPDDPSIAALMAALADPGLDDAARDALRRVVIEIARHWRKN